MFSSLVITFRETLEAALIAGIVLSYLARTGQRHHNRTVYLGIVAGLLASLAGAFLFNRLAGGFEGRAEEIFEGITMLVGAALLTTMILWMMRQRHVARELEGRVAAQLGAPGAWGLFGLVFVSILREGIETVIFLSAANLVSAENNLIGALIGIALAIALGYAIFVGSLKINLRTFFTITNVVLILFAAGLVAHGVHELEEAALLPPIIEHVWDINPPAFADGSYPLLHERGVLGSLLVGLFGYNGNPSLLETLSYVGYLAVVALVWAIRSRRSQEPS